MFRGIFLVYYIVGIQYTCFIYMGSSLYKILHKDYISESPWWGYILGMIIVPFIYPLMILAEGYDSPRRQHANQITLSKLETLKESLEAYHDKMDPKD